MAKNNMSTTDSARVHHSSNHTGIHLRRQIPFSGLNVIFIYTTLPHVCGDDTLFPKYIHASLKQAVLSQPGAHIYFGANFDQCPHLRTEITAHIPEVITFDILTRASERTKNFIENSKKMFSDSNNGLWTLSATRFFHIEDIMNSYNLTNVVHVEADNMLYGQLAKILPVLTEKYPYLAITPVYNDLTLMTASIVWIHNLAAIVHFNGLLVELSTIPSEWAAYKKWFTKYGGWFVSEMSILGYYHYCYQERMMLLPILSAANDYTYRCSNETTSHHCPLNDFRPGGSLVGPATGTGIWDSGSYGQFIGGTPIPTQPRGFMEDIAIIGKMLHFNPTCVADFLCSTRAFARREFPSLVSEVPADQQCVLAPFMRCARTKLRNDPVTGDIAIQHIYNSDDVVTKGNVGLTEFVNKSDVSIPTGTRKIEAADEGEWTPLWNLHVHSKKNKLYLTKTCTCN